MRFVTARDKGKGEHMDGLSRETQSARQSTSAVEPAGQVPEPKRKKRWPVAVGVVAAVVIVAGAGFFVWHEQPSFCNSVCHTPMDHTVGTYYSNDETLGVTEHAQEGTTCLQCHTADIVTQVTELTAWVSGDYHYDDETGQILETTADGLVQSYSESIPDEQFCLRSGCHTDDVGNAIDTMDQLVASKADLALNPHDFSKHGDIACGTCHKMHQQSTFVCTDCHTEALSEVPEHWQAGEYSEEALA